MTSLIDILIDNTICAYCYWPRETRKNKWGDYVCKDCYAKYRTISDFKPKIDAATDRLIRDAALKYHMRKARE